MNTKYFTDKQALDIPWIESPFFYSILDTLSLTEEQKSLCKDFYENGYVVLDLQLSDKEVSDIVGDMYKALEDSKSTFHADHFTYSDSKRIFEYWRHSLPIANLTMHQKVIDTLQLLYQKQPFPFSTINFLKGSNQPLHSDVIHFHTVPSLWMCGVWVALEDVNETNGALQIVPGSHKWPIYEYNNLNLPHPDSIPNGEAVNYRQYEEFIEALVTAHKGEKRIVPLKKGQALIWAANMLHGGCNVDGVTDLTNTRLSQANHYFMGICEQYYHPMFSEKTKGIYAKKWCNERENIKTYLDKLL